MPRSRRALSGSFDGALELWDLETEARLTGFTVEALSALLSFRTGGPLSPGMLPGGCISCDWRVSIDGRRDQADMVGSIGNERYIDHTCRRFPVR